MELLDRTGISEDFESDIEANMIDDCELIQLNGFIEPNGFMNI